MNGIYVEKAHADDCEFWIVRDAKTHETVAIGDTISHAVENYETAVANEQMAKELGVSLDDLGF